VGKASKRVTLCIRNKTVLNTLGEHVLLQKIYTCGEVVQPMERNFCLSLGATSALKQMNFHQLQIPDQYYMVTLSTGAKQEGPLYVLVVEQKEEPQTICNNNLF